MARAKLADETEFIPTDLAQARALQKALRAQGTPVSRARGIVAWLIELPEDVASGDLRATYRKELARLGSPPWKPPVALVPAGPAERKTHSYPYRRAHRLVEPAARLAA